MIPFLWNWLNEIKLKSHPSANIILLNLIKLPPNNKIEMMPIFFICITYSTTIINSILLTFIYKKNF